MILNNIENIKRVAIFFFYDKDGEVDTYVQYLISGLLDNITKLVIVCNGKLSVTGRQILERYTPDVIVRNNEGLDVWAYKEGLSHLGWKGIEAFDELLLLNNTIMGPVYPFKDMFIEMNRRDIDFWGITKGHEVPFDPFGYNEYGYFPEHIQTHFMAFRNSIIQTSEFQKYWDEFPLINSYQESVGLHETAFTKKFAEKGFGWDVYTNTEEYENITFSPVMYYGKELIEKKKCPIFKRKIFFQSYDGVMRNTTGQPGYELYEYLKKNKLYDVNMIWDNLLRTCNQAELVRGMQLTYILSSKESRNDVRDIVNKRKIALVMHLYFPDLFEESFSYAESMPSSAGIFITTNTDEKKKMIEGIFQHSKCKHVEVKVIENRGRDVSSLLIGAKDVVREYDYICFVHDKKTTQLTPGSIGESFAYKCLENNLHNEKFVENIILLFEENERLGLLSPPVPDHADYYPTIGDEWRGNYNNCVEIARRLGIKVPINKELAPIAPLGTCFWFRGAALKELVNYGWKYMDFPEEPNGVDHTILHAIERIYPFSCQQAGYYPAVLMVDFFAGIQYTNLNYYVQKFNQVYIANHIGGYESEMIDAARNVFEENKQLKDWIEIFKVQSMDDQEQIKVLFAQTSLKWQLKNRLVKLFGLK